MPPRRPRTASKTADKTGETLKDAGDKVEATK
jgi:hypothetical protein